MAAAEAAAAAATQGTRESAAAAATTAKEADEAKGTEALRMVHTTPQQQQVMLVEDTWTRKIRLLNSL